ncbi:MAG: hypothetical protein JWN04_563 [Myxococcaceae bacterium]|nr:hypothetical protein [Myxococcaceae bacterium]
MTSTAHEFPARSSLRLMRCVACLLLGFWLAQPEATAEDSLRVALEAGVTCLERKTLEGRLEVWLREPVDRDDLTVQIRGSEHDPRTALIRLFSGDELVAHRSFSPGPPRCADFHDAVAVAISMMLRSLTAPSSQAGAATEPARLRKDAALEPALSGPTENHAPPSTTAQASEPPRLPPAHHDADRLLMSTRASAVLGRQVGASLASGARLELSLGLGQRYGLRAGMLALFSSTESALQADTQVRYRTRPLAATLRGCAALFHTPTWLLHACAGLLAGRLRFQGLDGHDVRASPAAAQPWFVLEGELSLQRRLARSSWLFLGVSPVYGLRQLGVSATLADGSAFDRVRLHRLGALFAIGLAFDLGSAKDFGESSMNRR